MASLYVLVDRTQINERLLKVSLRRLFYVTWKRCTIMAGCCGSLFVGRNCMDQSSEP